MNVERSENYRVALPLFEGPLDLLLHLIRKNDLDLYDIPVSTILAQYLDYLQIAKELDIDLAGEFLEMAAELAWLKSRMLLPEPASEAEEGPDPREDLLNRLLEYQKYKLAAGQLMERPILDRDVFRRPATNQDFSEEEGEMVEIDALTLLSAFQSILRRLPKEQGFEVRRDRVGIAERVIELIELLRGRGQTLFESLFQGDRTRGEVVITLLALLEMARQKLLRIFQEQSTIVVQSLITDQEESS